MIAICFGVAYLVRLLAGNESHGFLLMVGGLLATIVDIGFRFRFANWSLIGQSSGGWFIFLPLWVLGIFWFIFGFLEFTSVIS